MDENARAFVRFSEILRLPGSVEEKTLKLNEALQFAIQLPVETIRAFSKVLELARRAREIVNERIRSDVEARPNLLELLFWLHGAT